MRRGLWLLASPLILALSGLAAGQEPVPQGGLPAATPADTPQAKIEKLLADGDALYLRRNDHNTWWETIARYKEALKIGPNSYGALWRMARCYFFMAERASEDDQKEELGMTGYQYGLKAIIANSKGVEGHYFTGIALGQYAIGISIISALAKGIDGKYTHHIETALKIDRYYDGAGPVIAMGRYFFTLPWPKYDGEQSIKFLREAIDHSGRLRPHFYLAETLLKEDQAQDALQEVQIVLDKKLTPEVGDYADDLWFQQQAPTLKKKIQEKLK